MDRRILDTINRAVAPLRHRVMLAIGRCVLQATKDDKGMQTARLSLLASEEREGVERMQEYGFTSRPLDGCEGVAVFVGGDRGHGVVVATDDRRHRKRGLQKGETAMYTDEGDYVLMKRGRIIEVVAGSKLHVTAPDVVVDASNAVEVNTGNATVNCDNATVKATTQTKVDCPESILTGNLTVQGTIIGQLGLQITGTPSGGGAAAQISGDMETTGGDVKADSISLKTHTHPGDSGGTTGLPQ